MGRMGRKNKREKKDGAALSWGTKNKNEGYDVVVKENSAFETYYKAQKIVPDDQWESFMYHLKEPLPASFRISGHRNQGKAILKIMEGEYFKALTEEQAKPECLTWYPENLAWQLSLTRKDIRKSEANVKLHNFLVSETEAGNISRQETVSMIPPLVLDVQPHHKVLDMCAAPGSKTSQLVEMLHCDEGKAPEGLVIANDSNNKRCYLLTHQLKRLPSPNLIITNHDASLMPNFHIPTPGGGKDVLKFDRILCDVPCSGDGTLRKNLDVWMKWNSANGSSLHGLQYRIARRGAEMLSVGGKMVYSTCSLNPMENEAVIHRLLVEAKGSLELEEVSDKLPGLKYVPGLSHWVVMSRVLTAYATPEEVPEAMKHILRGSLFPPKPEDADKFHLERCLRILPHQQNTGGFFVSALKKVAPLPWEAQERKPIVAATNSTAVVSTEVESTKDNAPRSPARKRQKIRGFKEDPYLFFDEDEELWPPIKEFYGLSDTMDPKLLLTRCKEGKKKNIYYTSPMVRDLTRTNEDRLTIINTGIKMFARSENKGTDCGYRIAQEGALAMMEFMKKRRVVITRDDMTMLLLNDDMNTPPEIHSFSSGAAKQLHEIDTGSTLMECYEDGLHIVVVAWKGKTSVRAYVAKCDRIHYLRLCGADLSKFEVNKFAEKERSAQNDLEEKEENQGQEDVSIDEGHKVPADMDNVEKEIPVDIDSAENQAPVNMDVVVKEDAVAE
ncbi:tRNA (cytosine(34)-C(5))-methyltransferase-like [Daphnia pulex]|uniref:tRNA (cytosine(34)-C(5))-methyltransferase-like n=1 Tax=Daphnia pulex TaxID=6669 RepID=UPI001EDEFAEA|nr:tRNA (cytosine(34)-C(5))-methyltransferase-like [Daphnia pulex]